MTTAFKKELTMTRRRTSGMGAVRPGILRVGYDGGGP